MGSPPRRPRASSGAEPPFEPPSITAPGGPPRGSAGEDQFEAPPMEAGDGAPTDLTEERAREPDGELLQVMREVEQRIFARPGPDAAARAAGDPPSAFEAIVGVGIGPAHRDFESVGPAGPGAPVLNVYVAEPMSMDAVKAVLVDSYGIRSLTSDRQPVNVIRTGPIDAYAHRHRERPVPCGISIGRHGTANDAGTLGALARGRSGPRANRLLLLSNNHVIANSNAAAVNDPIVQQGRLDGGNDPADRIAVLERWVTIDFAAGAANFVDCATGWCWPDRVRPDFIFSSGGAWQYFRVSTMIGGASVGMGVGKSGRTTQLTSGRVIDHRASIQVNYPGRGVANFRDQISIQGNPMQFSMPGDSGSLIWGWDSVRRPVGLLFAGGGQITFANKIDHVLNALDIALYT